MTDNPNRYKWSVIKTRKLVYQPPVNKSAYNASTPRPEVKISGKEYLR